MNKKKDIIFFLPNFSAGGAGESIVKICNGLNRSKFRPSIFCLGNCFYKNRLKKGTKIFEIKMQKTLFSFYKIINILEKNFNKKNTIFISNMNYANALSCIFVKLLLGYKLILIERTPLKELNTYYSFIDFIKKRIIYYTMKNFYRFSDLVILNSKFTQKQFKKKIRCKTLSIYSPSIDKVIFSNFKKKELKTKKDNLRILSIGRLSVEKRFDLLIKSMKYLKKNKYLNIVGNGPEHSNLKNLIYQNNLQKSIKIKKFNKNYKGYFKKHDLFISSSDFEGFPNIVVEALNNNLYVVSRDSGGGIFNILLNGKIGKIIDTNDPKVFAQQINQFLTNMKYYQGNKKLIRKNLKKFTSKIIIEKFNNLLESSNL